MNIAMVPQWLPTKDKGDWKHRRPPSGSRLLEERVSQRRDPDDDDGNVNNLEEISSRVDGSASRTDLIHMERVSSLPTGRIKRAEAHAPNSTPHEGSGIAKVKIAQSTPPSNITSATSQRPVISPSSLEQCRPPNEIILAHPNNNIDATSARNFNAKLDHPSNFRRLSRAERRRLLSEVKALLEDESLLSSLDGGHVSRHRIESGSDEDESLLLLSSCDGDSCDAPTVDTNNASTAFYTADYTADTRTQSQFTADKGGRDFDLEYYDDRYSDDDDDGILGSCDPFISFVTCAGNAGAVEIEKRERMHRNRNMDTKRGQHNEDSRQSIRGERNEREQLKDREEQKGQRNERERQNEREHHQVGRAEHLDDCVLSGASGNKQGNRSGGNHFSNNKLATFECSSADSDQTDPPVVSASENIEVEFAEVDKNMANAQWKDGDKDEDGAAVVIDSPLFLARDESFTRQRMVSPSSMVSSIKPTFFASAKSITSQRTAFAPVDHYVDRDVGDAVAVSTVVPGKLESLGRARIFTLQRLKSPFTRAKPSFSGDTPKVDEAWACVARHDGATTCSEPSRGTDVTGSPRTPPKIARTSCSPITQKEKNVWRECTDERSGKKYYFDGLISMWQRPVGVAPPSPKVRDKSACVETASTPETILPSPSSEKCDQQGPLAEEENRKSSRERNKLKSFFRNKKKSPHALAGKHATPQIEPDIASAQNTDKMKQYKVHYNTDRVDARHTLESSHHE